MIEGGNNCFRNITWGLIKKGIISNKIIMKAIAINGSPRKNRNTAKLLENALKVLHRPEPKQN
jgi:hypothetical protein